MKSIAYIDGNPYKVRLLKVGNKEGVPNEWDDLLNDLGEANGLLHWEEMFFWGQESSQKYAAYRAYRGYSSARSWGNYSASFRYVFIGFRPVLEPLAPEMPQPDQDGHVIQMGSLYMNEEALFNPKNPIRGGDIPDYIVDAALRIGDSDQNPAKQIQWVQWRKILVADRVLLKRVSWDDLNRQGLVFGEDKAFPLQSKYTNDEVSDAKAILRLIPHAEYVERTAGSRTLGVSNSKNGWLTDIDEALFPSIRPGEFAKLKDIGGGA